MIVAGTIDVAAAIIAESTLSFLGLGFPPDIPTWGRILYDGRDYMDLAMHWALFPGIAIFLTVLTINFVGDGLRDVRDVDRLEARIRRGQHDDRKRARQPRGIDQADATYQRSHEHADQAKANNLAT